MGIQAVYRTHGLSDTRAWHAWRGMIDRATNPKTINYARYGGRGIAAHPEWLVSFEAFLRDVGHAPSDRHSLDRIDNDVGYVPGNVRWATRSQQMRNTSLNFVVPFQGRQMSLMEAIEITGLPYATVWHRIRTNGWTPERALTTPVRHKAPSAKQAARKEQSSAGPAPNPDEPCP